MTWLQNITFDGIVCWLLGTHNNRSLNTYYEDKGEDFQNPSIAFSKNRETIQLTLLKISSKIIPRNSIINFVERAKFDFSLFTEDQIKVYIGELYNPLLSQLSALGFTLGNIRLKKYEQGPEMTPLGLSLIHI